MSPVFDELFDEATVVEGDVVSAGGVAVTVAGEEVGKAPTIVVVLVGAGVAVAEGGVEEGDEGGRATGPAKRVSVQVS